MLTVVTELNAHYELMNSNKKVYSSDATSMKLSV